MKRTTRWINYSLLELSINVSSVQCKIIYLFKIQKITHSIIDEEHGKKGQKIIKETLKKLPVYNIYIYIYIHIYR